MCRLQLAEKLHMRSAPKFLARLFEKRRKHAFDYRVYTREYDRIVKQDDLPRILNRLSDEEAVELAKAWNAFEFALTSWKTTGALHALDKATAIASRLTPAQRQDTVFSLLVDHSGSMRGQSILLAAAAVDITCEFLVRLGCKVEVLGFTTSKWKGGLSREKWKRSGEREQPGRLCDLLHIVYRSADEDGSPTLGYRLRNMLRPDLLKENVDGEAVEWAVSRLLKQRQTKKILLTVSDGVPMDDSTALANGEAYLLEHLKSVLVRLADEQSLRVAAVGLGFDVRTIYGDGITVENADGLATAMIDMACSLLVKSHTGSIEPGETVRIS